jgi:hypothetical protein
MLQPVSVGLKFGFLIVLFLFLFWVATSAMFDLRRRSHGGGGGRGQFNGASDETGWYSTDGLAELDEDFEPRLLVEHARGHSPGLAYDLIDGATLGRGEVEIRLDDPFASSRHARISRHGRTLVIEDLGSTNGTYLNEEPLNGPQPLHDGDRIKIGDSEFSYYE